MQKISFFKALFNRIKYSNYLGNQNDLYVLGKRTIINEREVDTYIQVLTSELPPSSLSGGSSQSYVHI